MSAEALTDFTLSLEDGESEGWGSWWSLPQMSLRFGGGPEEVDELSVLLDLNIEAKPRHRSPF